MRPYTPRVVRQASLLLFLLTKNNKKLTLYSVEKSRRRNCRPSIWRRESLPSRLSYHAAYDRQRCCLHFCRRKLGQERKAYRIFQEHDNRVRCRAPWWEFVLWVLFYAESMAAMVHRQVLENCAKTPQPTLQCLEARGWGAIGKLQQAWMGATCKSEFKTRWYEPLLIIGFLYIREIFCKISLRIQSALPAKTSFYTWPNGSFSLSLRPSTLRARTLLSSCIAFCSTQN